jgi:hypothetical protein
VSAQSAFEVHSMQRPVASSQVWMGAWQSASLLHFSLQVPVSQIGLPGVEQSLSWLHSVQRLLSLLQNASPWAWQSPLLRHWTQVFCCTRHTGRNDTLQSLLEKHSPHLPEGTSQTWFRNGQSASALHAAVQTLAVHTGLPGAVHWALVTQLTQAPVPVSQAGRPGVVHWALLVHLAVH